jgi:dynein heavy chain
MYRKIIQIDFFEKYQRWKLFSVWKSAMRNQRVQKCSRTLNAHLFALDMTLCDSLLKCRRLCVKLQSLNLLSVNPAQQPINLQDFEDAQKEATKDVVKVLGEVGKQIKDELLTSCTRSLELFLKANGFGKEEKEDTKRGDDTARDETERDEEAVGQTYTQRATTRTQCRKLTKFIRMVQYLFNDAIAVMVRHTTQKLLELLDDYAEMEEVEHHEGEAHAKGGHGAHDDKRRGGGHKPKFVIECLLEARGLRFEPPGKDVRECIETCLRDGLQAVSGFPAFLQDKEFSPFTTPLAELGDVLQLDEQQTDLFGLVHQDPKYKELMKKIGIRFDGLFDRVVHFADGYKDFVDMYVENESLKVQECSVTFADATLEDFKLSLSKYRQ